MARKSSLHHQAKTKTSANRDLPFEPSRRDEVLSAVREGRKLPHEADADAKANGYTLTREPDPTKFDPMKEARWSLPMVLAGLCGVQAMKYVRCGTRHEKKGESGTIANGRNQAVRFAKGVRSIHRNPQRSLRLRLQVAIRPPRHN